MIIQYLTNNSLQTKRIGKEFAKKILKLPFEKKAAVICLVGDLGGGKTTFLQGFAKGLGIKERILSPSFVIMRKFQIPKIKTQISKFRNFYHIDCYRIKKPKSILDLGFKKIISDPQNIIAIEWANQVQRIIPQEAIWIQFDYLGKNKRKIVIKNG